MNLSNQSIQIQCDLVVIGGGIAGCTAAMAAARLGQTVTLVQNRPVLGGNASSEIGLLMGGADRDFAHVREGGIIEEIDLLNRYHNHEVQWRNCISDALLERQVLETGVALYLNTHIAAVEMDGAGRIAAVSGAQQATEKSIRFSAPLFVDATGDGHIAALAGADFMKGSEARSEYGESLAPEEACETLMGSTLMFRVKDVGRPVSFVRPDWAFHYPSPADLPVKIGDPDRPQLWIEYGARMDTIGSNEKIRDHLLKILYGVWDHIKNHGQYGADNYVLRWVGSVPGKRESRRIVGDHVLTQNDLIDPPTCPDAVAYGGWPVDIHNADGFYAKQKWLDYTHLAAAYPISYRCYYSRNIGNLFMAGRCISATHVAHGSIRLIRTCAVGGQAVGTAAALCRQHGLSPRSLGEKHIEELQQTLLAYDCYIPGIVNNDPGDLARQAQISASSEHSDDKGCRYTAAKVVDGLSRGREGDENLWQSQPMREDPEPWLELRWNTPQRISRVQLTFDTMVREQRFFDRPMLGAMPTCVRDCRVLATDHEGSWRCIASIENNIQRHRMLSFEPVKTDVLRIVTTATHGDEHARLYEVRVYRDETRR